MRRKEGRKGGGMKLTSCLSLRLMNWLLRCKSRARVLIAVGSRLNLGAGAWFASSSSSSFFLSSFQSLSLSLWLFLVDLVIFFFDFYTSFAQLRNAEINLIDSWNSWNQFISPATTENIGWWITKYWLEFSNASVNCRLQSVNVCRFFGWSLTPFTYELNTIGRTKPNVNLRS